ncbi:MMPL family transporter [Gordonia sputi]|uniref:MMPL family transporter n=1 Tax=Gordonia sputi TaxID=36823 RepID=UPI0020441BD2|nr:MMPL family transporter [Gordonia sputi]MCM3897857.1 MMPL family transporter [Gordonia sputi]
MLARLTRVAISAPKRVLALAFLFLVLCGIYGASASQHLLAGGYSDPNSESAQAAQQIDDTFKRGGLQVVIKLDAPAGTDMEKDQRAAAVGKSIVSELDALPYVQQPVLSVWQDPTLAPGLISKDRSSALIIATLDGGEAEAPAHAKEVASRFEGARDGITVRVGGQGMVFQQVNEQTTRDLAVAEAIAIPISFLVLIVVFGGVIAAMLPIGVGIIAIVLTFALLRLIGTVTDVSIFALNLTTAMGLALAIDYTLLLVTRYREEVADGRDRASAILRTMQTAGRTVAFSAVTVALALAALAIFPMYFLRSFAYAGLGVVVIAAVTSLVITPAVLMLLGDRIDSLDVRRGVRKLLGRPEPTPRPVEEGWWYRAASWVLKRAAPVGATVVVILLVLGAPFLSIKFGFPDDRVLPTSASAHQIQQEIRDDFAQNLSSSVTVVATGDVSAQTRASYAQELSRVADVKSVSGAGGTFVDGKAVAPANPADQRGDVGVITVATNLEPMRPAGEHQLAQLRDVPVPTGLTVKFTGSAATNVDTVDSIYAHLPWVLGAIAIATFVLLFLFTGSVVLPLKALVLNVLSLSATFGAMVWFFQEGHLDGLGTTSTGYLAATMPVLMFCIAFGLSMDYEVFLLGRIRESWLASDRSRAANDKAVALGIARTGRVITAAALLMSIVFAGIAASEVSFMRMFGVGLTLAVLMDATLIRMLLVPSFMRLAGRLNWWAPAPLRRLHDRFGLSEEVDDEPPRTTVADTGTQETAENENNTQENSDTDQSQEPLAPRVG